MLSDFTHAQREQVAVAERKVEEYKEQLKRVSQVRNELKSHLQNLPDLTLLPSVTGGLAPLPSAGDLFNQ
ncbi:Regulation of nuclear pre-mRNA domain-containing protein 1B, partial [Stegodyphus mimosarum]